MKKALVFIVGFVFLQSCTDNHGGTMDVYNDGISQRDSNGGLADTAYHNESATDTSKLEHRVDISRRDTFDSPSQ
ncbi:MAG TPA: hypothetical protein VGN63_12305 [Flavisolibacter sp.]|jgi:hypothetical protein|nr:hypothetical protein [Flavisolibacter sp.]